MAEPMNPLAGASGPGKFSVRTDQLTMPSQYYGEGVETAAIKGAAPLAEAQSANAARASDVRNAAAQAPVTSLFAPTQRPGEPITAGIPMGEGPGPEALGVRPTQESLSQILAQMLPFDTNGEIAALYEQAVSRGM